MIRSTLPRATLVALSLGCGCSDSGDGGDVDTQSPGPLVTSTPSLGTMPATTDSAATPSVGAPVGAVAAPPAGGDLVGDDFIAEAEAVPVDEEDAECASTSTGTSLVGVVLAFTFDVSASMGSHFQPFYSRELKWEPVVAATKAFFADSTSAGVSATMTFFPNDQASLVTSAGGGGQAGGAIGGGGGDGSCDAAGYEVPDVGLTELPSDAFGTAIDAVTPLGDDDWRLGTPTGPALEGTIASIEAMRAAEPNARYVIVLVTDGEPALCSAEQDDMANVAGIVEAVADEIPTYVIGLGNPVTPDEPDPPTDGIDNLHTIAEAGGTGTAFLIDTNDPAKTTADFRNVIDSIRENSFACALEIPAPPEGEEFDGTQVNVNYSNEMGETPFVYDPTCTEQFAWYYDNPDAPSVIHMCESVCNDIKSDASNQGQLNVEFGCVRRVPGAK